MTVFLAATGGGDGVMWS